MASASPLRSLSAWLALLLPLRLQGQVSCQQAPNCTAGNRAACSIWAAFPNVCSECQTGAHGISGRGNAACLAPNSCAAIFPGQEACSSSLGTTPAAPFIVPFGRCACDDGTGLMWKTAPGMCAQVFVSLSGLYTLQKCSSRTCEPASCSTLTTWSPQRIGQQVPFECRRQGSDSMILSDRCKQTDTGPYTDSSLCGHPGFVASRVVEAKDHALNCVLAPQCPGSVLGDTRLAESCCKGTLYSRTVTEQGMTEQAAPGFCSIGLAAGEVCTVATTGPGWRGCSCLNSNGHPRTDRQCTVECSTPGCQTPQGGIPRTPEAWLTSAVPSFFFRAGRIGVAGAFRPSPVFATLLAAAAALLAPALLPS